MPRQSRLDLPGIPQHVIQRGNNRQPCFLREQDYRCYLRQEPKCLRREPAIHVEGRLSDLWPMAESAFGRSPASPPQQPFDQ